MVQHPLGGERPEAVARRAHQALEELTSLLGDPAAAVPTGAIPSAPEALDLSLPDDPEAVLAEFDRLADRGGLRHDRSVHSRQLPVGSVPPQS